MANDVLTIAQNASSIIGLESFSGLVNNSSPTPRAMLVLLNRGGQNLTRLRNTWGAGWTVLTREHEFTTVADQAEYVLPEDFEALIDRTVWDRSTYREARGVLSPFQWQEVRSGLIESTALTPRYRLRRNSGGTGRSIWLDPTPAGGDEIVLEYASKNWLVDADGSEFKAKITADTDEPLFDDDLVEQDLVWRYKQSRGLTFAAELAEFELERDRRIAEDAGARSIRVGGGRHLIRYPNVPEFGFGGVG